jgi:hypothetical protein
MARTKRTVLKIVDGGDSAPMPASESGQCLFPRDHAELMELFRKLSPLLPGASWWMAHGYNSAGVYCWTLATSASAALLCEAHRAVL